MFALRHVWMATRLAMIPALMASAGATVASAISFVTPAAGTLDAYDSILLEDGTRCRFARAVPTVTD